MGARFPLTYGECRARFRRAVDAAGWELTGLPISAKGQFDETLTIDVAAIGSASPRRVLVVMSGTHGIEGFAGSAVQCEAPARLRPREATDAIVFVHGVNPWGMSWWRRANESNVDLNRNWRDFSAPPPPNDGYRAIHPHLCPATGDLPEEGPFLDAVGQLVETHGIAWVREAVSGGQYSHPDGMYFGGARREESTERIAEFVVDRLAGVDEMLLVDLHTGLGEYGTYTILSSEPPGGEGDTWMRTVFDADRVESTSANPDAITPDKVGQLGHGLVAALGADPGRAITLEFGTADEATMILAERAEHWVHRFGDRSHPDHAAAIWAHRIGSIPDDPDWEARTLHHGALVLDQAAGAAFSQLTMHAPDRSHT